MNDRARFERLALAHMNAVFNLAVALLRRRNDAEDAVQDAYLRAYRAFPQFQGQDIKPWLLTIVRNVCYRHLQERRRAGNVISLDETLGQNAGAANESNFATAIASPEEEAMANSESSVLSQAIGALPPAFREVIILRELEELSYREVADVIGAPIGTVMSRLSRARIELRTLVTKLMVQGNKDAM